MTLFQTIAVLLILTAAFGAINSHFIRTPAR
jgi:hypothetical protein